ncbi:MAG: hypothetical protein J1F36_01735 [Clostridiales bacterium]|nr:hypothetical protein [Clostridiales bacterium]
MRKLFVVIVAAFMCVSLCACTSQAENLKKKYEKDGYNITGIESRDLRFYGIDTDKLETRFAAIKGSDVAFVVEYKSGDDAKALYDSLNAKGTLIWEFIDGMNYTTIKKNNTVIFGTKDAVELIK